MITRAEIESPFLDDIMNSGVIQTPPWQILPPVHYVDPDHLQIRIHGQTFAVRSILRSLNYQWSGNYWVKNVNAGEFSVERLSTRPWIREGLHVEVFSHDGQLIEERHF